MNNQTNPVKSPILLIAFIVLLLIVVFAGQCNADGPVVMTWYSPETSGGEWLQCGYLYHDVRVPFVAVTVEDYARYAHHRVYGIAGGVPFSAVVLDSGYLEGYCVEQPSGECWPIALDMAREWFVWPGLSTAVEYEVGMDSWWGML